jgi:voltage-gated potassium channel
MAVVDLLAILPFFFGFLVDLRTLRLIRTLRTLRLFKIYRYNRAMQSFAASFREVRDELYMLGVASVVILIVSSALVFECERVAQPEMFKSFGDALWWGVATLTTIGYGDKFPITAAGRLIAIGTLLMGLGVFGTFVSVVGSAFVKNLRGRSADGPPGPVQD